MTYSVVACMLVMLCMSCKSFRHAPLQDGEQKQTQPRLRPSPSSVTAESIERSLDEILSGVQPWIEHILPWADYATNYSKASWDSLISAAQVIQSADPQLVEEALRGYQQTHHKGSRSDDSKLLLLMRVAFDLPETGSLEQLPGFGGWRDWSRSGREMSPAWPITWNNGDPKLIVGFTAFQGQRYDAGVEFRYFVSKYPWRNFAPLSK